MLARAGVASRRGAEQLIAEGRVRVGGRVIQEQGVTVDPALDVIEVDGRRVELEPLAYILFHKPRLVVSTMRDPAGRPAVHDYMREVGSRVVPVGRLDFQTSGVMLLTNDGDLARALLHPSSLVLKEYLLEVKGTVDDRGLERFRQSIPVGDTWTRPAEVTRVQAGSDKTALVLTLHEGKNRQVRRLAEHAGYEVIRLERQRFAGLSASGLRPGQWRHLSAAELKALRALAPGVRRSAP